MFTVKMLYKVTNAYPGPQLKAMLKRASEWATIQRKSADAMTGAWYPYVPGWRGALLAYKKDKSKPNPFEEPDPGKPAYKCVHGLKLNSPQTMYYES